MGTFDLISVLYIHIFSQCCLWSLNIKQITSFISNFHQTSESYISVSSEVRMIISQRTDTKDLNTLRQSFSLNKSYLLAITSS